MPCLAVLLSGLNGLSESQDESDYRERTVQSPLLAFSLCDIGRKRTYTYLSGGNWTCQEIVICYMNWTYNFAHHLSYTDLSTLVHGSCSANKTHNAKGMELVPSLLDLRRKHETRHDSLDSWAPR